jgi:hypothetical protein
VKSADLLLLSKSAYKFKVKADLFRWSKLQPLI